MYKNWVDFILIIGKFSEKEQVTIVYNNSILSKVKAQKKRVLFWYLPTNFPQCWGWSTFFYRHDFVNTDRIKKKYIKDINYLMFELQKQKLAQYVLFCLY